MYRRTEPAGAGGRAGPRGRRRRWSLVAALGAALLAGGCSDDGSFVDDALSSGDGAPGGDALAPAGDGAGADTGVACAPDPALLAAVDPERMRADLEYLVGLGERRSPAGQTKAAAYLRRAVEGLPGWQLVEHRYTYQGRTFSNLELTLSGSDPGAQMILAGAHYDSASDDPYVAPGADDNASGTVAVLEVARVLAESGCQPRSPVRLLFFSNEESGMIGSTAYVEQLRPVLPPAEVRGFINVDMVGYGPDDEDLDVVTRPEHTAFAKETAAAAAAAVPVNERYLDACG